MPVKQLLYFRQLCSIVQSECENQLQNFTLHFIESAALQVHRQSNVYRYERIVKPEIATVGTKTNVSMTNYVTKIGSFTRRLTNQHFYNTTTYRRL